MATLVVRLAEAEGSVNEASPCSLQPLVLDTASCCRDETEARVEAAESWPCGDRPWPQRTVVRPTRHYCCFPLCCGIVRGVL
jgi:hypothetical protein